MLLEQIDAFLRRTKMSPTRFGRDAVRDPHFVLGLRAGRRPRRNTTRRVIAYMRNHEARRIRSPGQG
jgi:hypothetical protein